MKWMQGMADTDGTRVLKVLPNGQLTVAHPLVPVKIEVVDEGALLDPDWTDPATTGCLLAQVREAWGIGAVVGELTDYSESYDAKGGRLEIRLGPVPLFRASGGTRVDRLLKALDAEPNGKKKEEGKQ